MNSTKPSWSSILKDPLVWGNALLRLALLAWVVSHGFWRLGDANHYLYYAQQVCQGEWGGEPSRTPFYLWFLCLLSPQISHAVSALQMALPLFIQTFVVWTAGLLLYRGGSRRIATFWLFDPLLLAYSFLVMTDAFFAVTVLALALVLQQEWTLLMRPQPVGVVIPRVWSGQVFKLGVAMALVMLTRPTGLPLIMWTVCAGVLCILWFVQKRRGTVTAPSPLGNVFMTRLILAVVLSLVLVAPRVYWNGTHFGKWVIADQGRNWIKGVAGVVENYGLGLDYAQSEQKWWDEHKDNATVGEAYKSLLGRVHIWAFLSAKGVVRVFFGHGNVEWSYLLTGVAPVGPGWFRSKENRPGAVEGVDLVFWVFGVLVTAFFCGYVYLQLGKRLWREKLDPYLIWTLGGTFFLAIMPQLYGDARFRTALWPLILMTWLWTERSSGSQSGQ